jgi:chemotaxis protein MotB
MAGKGGGAWKVAYADFVTAMMAFFLVMWITAQSDKVKKAISQHFNAPFESTTRPLHKNRNKDQALIAPIKNNLTEDPADLDARRAKALTVRESDRPATATIIFFEEDSDELTDRSKNRLAQLVPWVVGKPHKIEIRGHASRKPLPEGSPFRDAWQLSYARCISVMKHLEQLGISPERIRLSQAAGYEPYTTRVEAEWQARNSRVEVYLLSELVRDFVGTRDERGETHAGL